MEKLFKSLKSVTFDYEGKIENENLRRFLHVFTEMGSTLGAVIIISFLAFISGINVLYVFVPIYLFQLLMVEAIKIIFRKPRPAAHKHKNLFGLRITSGSFPSGHTSNIFALSFLISNFYQLNIFGTLAVFAVAGIIAFSRILLGRHYTIDVAAGALCGLTFSVIGALILPNLLRVIL
jgi:membrane-associated phospholipid phosphatase